MTYTIKICRFFLLFYFVYFILKVISQVSLKTANWIIYNIAVVTS